MPRLDRLLLSGLLLLAGPLAAAAGAPTDAAWKPLKALIEANDSTARSQLDTFMRDRAWPDGWAILADLDRQAGDWEASRAHADTGLSQSLAQEGASNPHRDRVRSDAAWLLVHALNRLGRPAEGPAVLVRLGQHPDLIGRTRYQLSRGALQQGDPETAHRMLSEAMALAQQQGQAIPAEYRFHEAAIYETLAERLRDATDESSRRRRVEALEAAAASYTRALAETPEQHALLFNLARMQRDLARLVPAKAAEHLEASRKTSLKLLQHQPDDAEARVGLCLVLLAQKNHRDAANGFADALQGLAKDPQARAVTLQTAHRGRGAALLELAKEQPQAYSVAEAYEHLLQAKSLGDTSADLSNNLLVAALTLAGQSKDPAEQARYRAVVDEARTNIGGALPLNLAIAAHDAAAQVLADGKADAATLQRELASLDSAAAILAQAVGADPADATTWTRERNDANVALAAEWRYLGHVHRVQGEAWTALAAVESSDRSTQHRTAWTRALAAYRTAGDLTDHDARRHYLHLATRIDAEAGYAGGWVVLGWRSYLSMDGWTAVLGNYSGSGAWKHPLHLVFWALLVGIPLLLGLKGMLIGTKAASVPAARPASASRRPAARAEEPPPAPAPAPSPAGTEPRKDATLLPDSLVRASSGALQLREGSAPPVAATGTKPTDAKADATQAYEPSTQEAGKARDDVKARAAAQVAKRLAEEQPASKPRPRRR